MGTVTSPQLWSEPLLPRPWKLGSLAASLVLVSQAVRLFPIASQTWTVSLFGLVLTLPVGAGGLVALFIVLFALSGMDWLLQDHPLYREIRHRWVYAVMPTLTAWTLEMALLYTPPTALWWVALLSGALLLVAILVAEYVSADPGAPGYWLAQIGLTTLGFLLFFLLSLYAYASHWRLLWVMPLLTVTAGLITLRLFLLYSFGRFCVLETLIITLLTSQALMVLYHANLSALGYALTLTGWMYILHMVLRNLREGTPLAEALREPLFVMFILGSVLLWLEWR